MLSVVRQPVMPRPSQQAMHARLYTYTAVDGILIGDNAESRGDHKDRARQKLRKRQNYVDKGMHE